MTDAERFAPKMCVNKDSDAQFLLHEPWQEANVRYLRAGRNVAPKGIRLYRRLATGRRMTTRDLPITNRRYSRLPTCATAPAAQCALPKCIFEVHGFKARNCSGDSHPDCRHRARDTFSAFPPSPVRREREIARRCVDRNGPLHGAAPLVPSPIGWERVRVRVTFPALFLRFTHIPQENRLEWNFQ
jgi:hypothetical protein